MSILQNRTKSSSLARLGLAVGIAMSANGMAMAGPFSIPADEAPHNSTIEWWYYTGHLSGKDVFGITHNYGFQYTNFRLGLGAFPLVSGYVGNFAVTDLNRGVHEGDARLSIGPDVLLSGGGYNEQVADWNIHARDGAGSITAATYTANYAANLNVHPLNYGVVWNGDDGVMPQTAAGALNYYSFPSLAASGVIVDHGLIVPVSGTAWFDHEWSPPDNTSSGGSGAVAWNWYAVELADGRKYNISIIKDADNNTLQTYGTWIAADGSYGQIDPSQIDDQPAGVSWTSPRSGLTYNTKQILKVPGGQVVVTGLVQDQEMATFQGLTGSIVSLAQLIGMPNTWYWEGDSSVTGSIDGVAVTGKAYLELNPSQKLPGT